MFIFVSVGNLKSGADELGEISHFLESYINNISEKFSINSKNKGGKKKIRLMKMQKKRATMFLAFLYINTVNVMSMEK